MVLIRFGLFWSVLVTVLMSEGLPGAVRELQCGRLHQRKPWIKNMFFNLRLARELLLPGRASGEQAEERHARQLHPGCLEEVLGLS